MVPSGCAHLAVFVTLIAATASFHVLPLSQHPMKGSTGPFPTTPPGAIPRLFRAAPVSNANGGESVHGAMDMRESSSLLSALQLDSRVGGAGSIGNSDRDPDSPSDSEDEESLRKRRVYDSRRDRLASRLVREGSATIGPASRLITIFPNDFVVHRDLGVAQYVHEIDDDEQWPGVPVIRLMFAKEAQYIVPPEERCKLARLKGADATPPKLTELSDRG